MRKRYKSATEIGIRLQHSNEQLDFIRRHDPELYTRILEYLEAEP